MAIWFVSRHQGAIDWIKQQNIKVDHFVQHLDIAYIQADDMVIGTLPMHLAAQVCAKGATFYFLVVNLQAHQRGSELTAQQLMAQDCHLEAYYIEKL